MSMEQIIRPFAAPQALATRRVAVSVSEESTEEATLVWGKAGDLPEGAIEDDGAEAMAIGFKVNECNDLYKERSRKFQVVRVHKNNDPTTYPNTYVDEERTTDITFSHAARKALVGAISSQTTSFSDIPITDTATWGEVNKREQCNATYTLRGAT